MSESIAASVKQFCKILSAYNVIRIEANYDGSGDSGDLEIYVITCPTAAEVDARFSATSAPATISCNEKRTTWRQWLPTALNDRRGFVTTEKARQFEDNLFDLLPNGWEINEGSYGEISIVVSDESILIEHNERYIEIRHEVTRY